MTMSTQTVPAELLKNFKFKTDIKSLSRGLNSLLGLNMGIRSRLRSLRVANDKTPFLIASQFDLIRFILVADKLSDSHKGLKYNENKDSYEFIERLTGDTNESLFIYEDIDVDTYTKDLVSKNSLKEDKCHFYSDELSSLLDSYQVNNGLIFLFHGPDGSYYILNRALSPDPDNDARFFFYTKLFKLSNSVISDKTNFVEINRFTLEVKSHTDFASADSGQMVLPVIHLS